jgi:hypothetical protein
MKKMIIIAVVVVAVATIAWLIFVKKPADESTIVSSGFGGQLFDDIRQNPADKLPETNPFGKDLNPYEKAYANPFK